MRTVLSTDRLREAVPTSAVAIATVTSAVSTVDEKVDCSFCTLVLRHKQYHSAVCPGPPTQESFFPAAPSMSLETRLPRPLASALTWPLFIFSMLLFYWSVVYVSLTYHLKWLQFRGPRSDILAWCVARVWAWRQHGATSPTAPLLL